MILRALDLSVAYEPTNIFAEICRPNGQGLDHRRPDILVHNPYGGGSQVLIKVALFATDGQTRATSKLRT